MKERTRRKRRRLSENDWRPSVRPKRGGRRNIGKWKKNERRFGKKFEIR